MYGVELRHWVRGCGWRNSEAFDLIDEPVSAREYWENWEDREIPFDGLSISVLDEDGGLLSEFFIEKED